MGVFAWVVGVALMMLLLMAGSGKITSKKMSTDMRDNLGVSEQLWKVIGGLEIAGAAGVFIGLLSDGDTEWIGAAAGLGAIAVAIGAGVYHQRANDEAKEMAGAVMLLALGALYLIGLGAR